MRTEDERERGFDAHLRQMLRETTAGSSSACLDAETLAAWSAGVLPPVQARAVESHVASCATCGAMLAAFARADVEESLPVTEEMPFWRRWRLQWVMPIAATATALAVWVAVPDRPPVQAPLPSTSESTSLASPPAPASPSSAENARVAAPGGDERRAREEALTRRSFTQERGEAADKLRQDAQAGSAPQQVDRLDAPAPADAAAAKTFEVAPVAAPEVAAPSTSAPAPPAPAATAAPASARASGTAAAADSLRASLSARANGANRVSEIRSPDPNVRWRATPQGRVEFTTTGGREWTPATLGNRGAVAGAAFRDSVLESALGITAGTSPDVQTCWLVGLRGVVLRSTDGRTFAPVAFPETVDLRAIQASDAQRAIVMAADGRRFETTDGGATWVVR